MLSAAQALQNALDKRPGGFAWTRASVSNWGRLFTPAAAEQVLFETASEAQTIEAFPSAAGPLLPDYERALGPDPCLGPMPATLAERRQSAHTRWTERGGASRAHFIAVAATLGYAVTIEEFRAPRAGLMRAGGRVYDRRVRFTWRVHAPSTAVVPFRAGQSKAGDKLNRAGLPVLDCNLRRRAPAHTTLIMAYATPEPVTDGSFGVVTDGSAAVVTDGTP